MQGTFTLQKEILMSRFAILFFIVLLTTFPVNVFGQTLPSDFKNWEEIGSTKVNAVLGGKNVSLGFEYYVHTDLANLKRQTVNLLHDENVAPWLAVYYLETGEKHPDGSIYTKESVWYIFENIKDNWVFVKDFSNDPSDPKLYDFLKQRYGLEFK